MAALASDGVSDGADWQQDYDSRRGMTFSLKR